MLTTEEYSKQILEQKINELHKLIDEKRNEINNIGFKKIFDGELDERDIFLCEEYFRLMKKYLRLTRIIV